jgi:hypothetical protein
MVATHDRGRVARRREREAGDADGSGSNQSRQSRGRGVNSSTLFTAFAEALDPRDIVRGLGVAIWIASSWSLYERGRGVPGAVLIGFGWAVVLTIGTLFALAFILTMVGSS